MTNLLKELKEEEFNLEMNMNLVDMTDEQYEYQKGRLNNIKARIERLEMEDDEFEEE